MSKRLVWTIILYGSVLIILLKILAYVGVKL